MRPTTRCLYRAAFSRSATYQTPNSARNADDSVQSLRQRMAFEEARLLAGISGRGGGRLSKNQDAAAPKFSGSNATTQEPPVPPRPPRVLGPNVLTRHQASRSKKIAIRYKLNSMPTEKEIRLHKELPNILAEQRNRKRAFNKKPLDPTIQALYMGASSVLGKLGMAFEVKLLRPVKHARKLMKEDRKEKHYLRLRPRGYLTAEKVDKMLLGANAMYCFMNTVSCMTYDALAEVAAKQAYHSTRLLVTNKATPTPAVLRPVRVPQDKAEMKMQRKRGLEPTVSERGFVDSRALAPWLMQAGHLELEVMTEDKQETKGKKEKKEKMQRLQLLTLPVERPEYKLYSRAVAMMLISERHRIQAAGVKVNNEIVMILNKVKKILNGALCGQTQAKLRLSLGEDLFRRWAESRKICDSFEVV